MKEDFLHYVWKFQKLNKTTLRTVDHKLLQVIKVGQHNMLAGPDFFNGQLIIDTQKWAGTIEIHSNSSDWYAHGHEKDPAYDTVILHVVWHHDVEVFRADNTPIPTLELKNCIPNEIVQKYQLLFSKNKKFINCEQHFDTVATIKMNSWLERLYVERLEQKSIPIQSRLIALQNHWEALLFELLCKNFGSKINGASFLSIAQSIPFSVVQKCRQSPQILEALLLGQAGLLSGENDSPYFLEQKEHYAFLKQKFKLENTTVIQPHFFRLRPPNFPTIRLSQLAALYARQPNLFSVLSTETTVEEINSVFKVSALPYWKTHYNFDVVSKRSPRKLTKDFVNLLIINTIIPLQFAFQKFNGVDGTEHLFALAQKLPKEQNSIIKKFNALRPTAKNGLESQALLQLKTNYCDKLQCLQCVVGNQFLKA